MEYCSVDTEAEDTLELLRPSVKRLCRKANSNREFHPKLNSQGRPLKCFRSVQTRLLSDRRIPSCCNHVEDLDSVQSLRRDSESSPSLVLYQGTEDVVTQDTQRRNKLYCARYLNEKPLINIKVINENQRVEATSPNEEQFVQTKNFFLVIAGHKKEKLYEIKTTNSANFNIKKLRNKDDWSLDQIAEYKAIVKSLNMEKKKKKKDAIIASPGGDKKSNNRSNSKPREQINVEGKIANNCTCYSDENEIKATNINSRVKIYGQLGINHDNKYVLNCHATMDDKPIDTQVYKFPVQNNVNKGDEYKRNYYAYNVTTPNPLQSQGIQVQNLIEAKAGLQNQQQRPSVVVRPEYPYNYGHEDMVTKMCPPLVVVSVYPHDTRQNNFEQYKDFQCQCNSRLDANADPKTERSRHLSLDRSRVKKTKSKSRPTTPKQTNVKRTKSNSRPASPESRNSTPDRTHSKGTKTRSRTLSAGRNNTKITQQSRHTSPNNADVKGAKQKPRPKTPSSPTIKNQNKSTPQRKMPLGASPKTTVANMTRIIRTNKTTTKTMSTSPNRAMFDRGARADSARQSDLLRTPRPKSRVTKGTNTDHVRVKKQIIEGYTRKISQGLDNNTSPRHVSATSKPTVSRMQVNIDSENEHYDLQFEKDEFTTGMAVKKTMKVCTPCCKEFGSMDVCPRIFRKVRPLSPTGASQNSNANDIPTVEHTLNIKDSTEIYHSRDSVRNVSSPTKSRQMSFEPREPRKSNDSAPMKHFKGDKCPVQNPMQRDKEIRMLLGIEGIKNNSVDNNRDIINTRKTSKSVKDNAVRKGDGGDMQEIPEREKEPSVLTLFQCVAYNNTDDKIQTQNKNTISTQYDYQLNKSQELLVSGRKMLDLQIQCLVKRKPIVLSRKQYEKIKRTILKTMCKKMYQERNKFSLCSRYSFMSLGELRKKPLRTIKFHFNQEVQTEKNSEVTQEDSEIHDPKIIEIITETKDVVEKSVETDEPEINDNNKLQVDIVARNEVESENNICKELVLFANKETLANNETFANSKTFANNETIANCKTFANNETLANNETFANNVTSRREKVTKIIQGAAKKVVSSMEIHYASVSYMKQVKFTSAHMGTSNDPGNEEIMVQEEITEVKTTQSLHTLYKQPKTSCTPNLGTSVYSMVTSKNSIISTTPGKAVADQKTRKPFLSRLMSCLVMRSTNTNIKMEVPDLRKARSMDSVISFDSYHINTSLAAPSIDTSLYDTSESFYTNHSIEPAYNKSNKKGFLSSFRSFLTSRRS